MTYTAWVIPPYPAADLLNQLVVTDDGQNGRAVASRVACYGVGTVQAWDAGLAEVGYERTSPWQPAEDGWRFLCAVAPSPPSPAS